MTKRRLVQLGIVGCLMIILATGGFLAYKKGKLGLRAEGELPTSVNLTAVLPSIADDIVQNYWAEKYIVAVQQPNFGASGKLPIMNNYQDSTFRPDLKVTREFLAVWLMRASRKQACCSTLTGDSPCRTCQNRGFTDVATNYWAWPWIEAMAEYGYMSGYGDNSFRPSETASISALKTILGRMGIATASPPGWTPVADSSILTRAIFAAFVAYNLNLPGESDYPSVYLQWVFPIDPNAGFDFGYEVWRDGSLLYVQDPPEQGMEVGSDLGMFYDKSMTGAGTYTYYVYLMNRDGDYSAPATVSITVP